MSYIDGFVVPVPVGNKDAYRDFAVTAAAVMKDDGATRVVAAWGEDVPDGKVTDFMGAVKAAGDEKVRRARVPPGRQPPRSRPPDGQDGLRRGHAP